MQLVLTPERFQVIVTSYLSGDILTDLGAALTGGMGVAPSANLNTESTPLFEPVHGSAPDIAGKGIVNPIAMALSSALMLEELGHVEEAKAIWSAAEKVVQDREITKDLGGTLGTSQAMDALLKHVQARF